jgi:anti-anti-sigma regulatory factor
MDHLPFKLQYGDGDPSTRLAELGALKLAMTDALGAGGPAQIDAHQVARVDSMLIQLLTLIAQACHKRAQSLCIFDPPIDLVLGFDKLGIDWRGLNISFSET